MTAPKEFKKQLCLFNKSGKIIKKELKGGFPMKLAEFFNKKRIVFIALFAVLAFIAYRVNFSPLLGVENQAFTYFQFFGPTAGIFLGPVAGALSVLAAQIANFVLLGKSFELINLIRLTPMVFAALYFGAKRKRLAAIAPLACMAAFILHPVGMQAWFYSLLWLIPLLGTVFKKNLFAKAMGSTFTAHAVGATAFLYAVPTTPEFWAMLIPITLVERFFFASGISLSYIGFNSVLSWIEHRVPSGILNIDRKYALGGATA